MRAAPDIHVALEVTHEGRRVSYRTTNVHPEKTFTCGRDPASVAIHVPYEQASRSHVTIHVVDAATIEIRDHSRNGTLVDGVLLSNERRLVGARVRLDIGPYSVAFEVSEPPIDAAPPIRAPSPFVGAPAPLGFPPLLDGGFVEPAAAPTKPTLIAGRFHIPDVHPSQRHLQRGRDHRDGTDVIVYDRYGHDPIRYEMLSALHALDLGHNDRRVARMFRVERMTLLEAGPEVGRAAADSVARAALALIELSVLLAPRGLAPWCEMVWLPSDGSSDVRVPVLPGAPSLDSIAAWAEAHGIAVEGASHRDPRALASLLARYASDRTSAESRAAVLPRSVPIGVFELDFDALIRSLERESGPGVATPLAAALHHRGCVRTTKGDLHGALSDAARATALDGFAVYWTTRALIEERLGLVAAQQSHDAAVAGVGGRTNRGPQHFAAIRSDQASRSWLARGVYRAASR